MKLHCVNWLCGGFYPFAPNVQRPVVTRHRHGVFHMYAIALVAWLEVNLRLAHLGTESPLRSTHSGKFPPKHFIFDAHVICQKVLIKAVLASQYHPYALPIVGNFSKNNWFLMHLNFCLFYKKTWLFPTCIYFLKWFILIFRSYFEIKLWIAGWQVTHVGLVDVVCYFEFSDHNQFPGRGYILE